MVSADGVNEQGQDFADHVGSRTGTYWIDISPVVLDVTDELTEFSADQVAGFRS